MGRTRKVRVCPRYSVRPAPARTSARVTWDPSRLDLGDSRSDAAPQRVDYPNHGYVGLDRSWSLIQSVDYSLKN